MPISTEQISELITAITDLKDTFEGLRDTWDARVAAAEAAYDTLSGNMRGVVGTEMHYIATVDPDATAPTNRRGGVFTSLKSAIEAAPHGAYVRLKLLSGKTYQIPDIINCYHRTILFEQDDAGTNPVVEIPCTIYNGENSLRAFVHSGATFIFKNVDINLPTALADGGVGMSPRSSMVEYEVGLPAFASFYGCTITGGVPGTAIGILSNHGSAQSNLGLYQCSLDGPFYGVNDAGLGTTRIQANLVTLLNGAALHNGGTLGADLLMN